MLCTDCSSRAPLPWLALPRPVLPALAGLECGGHQTLRCSLSMLCYCMRSFRRVNTVQGGSAGRRIGQGSEPTHGRLLLAFQHKPGCRSFRSPPIVVAAGQNHLISDSDSISAPVFLVQRTSPSATQVRSEPPSRPRRGPRWLRRVWTPTLTVNGRRPNCRFHPMIAFARFDIGDTSRGGFDKFPCRRPGPKNCTDFRESGPGRSCLLGSDDIRQIPASQSSTTT